MLNGELNVTIKLIKQKPWDEFFLPIPSDLTSIGSKEVD